MNMSSDSNAIMYSELGRQRTRRMLQTSPPISLRLQLLFDIAIVEGALYLAMLLRGIENPSPYYSAAAIVPLLMWLVYSNSGIYRRFAGDITRSAAILWAWTKVMVMLVVLAFVAKISEQFSRQVILHWFVIGALAQVLLHSGGEYLIRKYKKEHGKIIPSILVGNSKLGKYLADHINSNPWTSHKIVGVLCDAHKCDPNWQMGSLPFLGGIEELRGMVKEYEVRRVYFALPMKTAYRIHELEMELIDLNVDIVWAPDIFALHMTSPSVREVAGVPLYYLSESPLVEGARINKMLMDKVLSAMALVVFSPIMIGAALAVKMTSPGPVFFRQGRHGLDGKIIHVLKFRSMRMHEEEAGKITQATVGDDRITRVGAFMRKTSIDELPQLLNVLKGEMSLVGPRPHARAHNHYYADKITAYMLRHRILPGMTGLAQVNGCRGETEALEKMEKRVEYDLTYINNWSIWMDIRILIKTVFTLLSRNAY